VNELAAFFIAVKLKLLTTAAAAFGALMIAATDPPATRSALFLRAFVAIGASILFGNIAVVWLDGIFHFSQFVIPFANIDAIDFHVAVHGLVGALAWFVVGAVATLGHQFKESPIELFKKAKDAFKGG
jgi:hypothetical protein